MSSAATRSHTDRRFVARGGRSVITDALRQLVQLAFQELGIEALHARIIEENATSHNGRRMDRVYFDLTARDPR